MERSPARTFIFQPWTLFEKYLPSALSGENGGATKEFSLSGLARARAQTRPNSFPTKIGKIEEGGWALDFQEIRPVGGKSGAPVYFERRFPDVSRFLFHLGQPSPRGGKEHKPVQSRPIQWLLVPLACSVCSVDASQDKADVFANSSRKLRRWGSYLYIYHRIYHRVPKKYGRRATRTAAASFHKYSYSEKPRVNQGPRLF